MRGNEFVDVVGPVLESAGYVRKGKVWVQFSVELVRIVQLLSQHGPQAKYTLEFGLLLAKDGPLRLDVAFCMLRARLGQLVTTNEPGTDWWIAFERHQPFLTAYGFKGEMLSREDLHAAVADRLVPILSNYSMLSDVEKVLYSQADWLSIASVEAPPKVSAPDRDQAPSVNTNISQAVDPSRSGTGYQSHILDSICVERHLDMEASEHPELFGDFVLSVGDEIAYDYEAEVLDFVHELRFFPGIDDVRQEDRRVVYGWGRPDLTALQDWARQWWTEVLVSDR